MRKLAAIPVIVALLLLTALPASAAVERQTWDDNYSLGAEQFCGFAVDVHDYGWNVYRHVSPYPWWSWDKTWQGTRLYTNPENDRKASFQWTWRTIQSVESQTDTAVTLIYTSNGTARVSAVPGGVVASQAGHITFRRSLELVDGQWMQVGGDEPIAWDGPHELDLGSAFCDAMIALLNPGS